MINKMRVFGRIIGISTFLCICLLVQSVSATLTTSPGALNPAATIIDFEAFTVGTPGPITDGFATMTSSGSAIIKAQEFTQIPGIFEGQYFGFGAFNYFIDFANPVSEFGFGIFDVNFVGNEVRVLDTGNAVLEMVTSGIDFPVGPSGGGFSTFVGFTRAANDISRIELLFVKNPLGDDFLGIDTVTYFQDTSAVPEPTTVALLGIGLAGLAGTAVRRRLKKGK